MGQSSLVLKHLAFHDGAKLVLSLPLPSAWGKRVATRGLCIANWK